MRQSQNADTLSHYSGVTGISGTGKVVYHEIKKFVKLVKMMAELNYDIRRLNYLRLSLIKETTAQNPDPDLVPLAVFQRAAIRILQQDNLVETEAYALIKQLISPVEEPKARLTSLALNDLKEGGLHDSQEPMISLNRLNLLVELYHYYPVFRTQDRNVSTELYYILSSNKKGTALENSLSKIMTTESSKEALELDKPSGRLTGASKT